jgi:hypothetical protein
MSTKGHWGGRKINCEKEALYNKKSIQLIGLLDNGKREYKNIWHSQLKKGEKNLKVFPISLNLQMTLQTMVFYPCCAIFTIF